MSENPPAFPKPRSPLPGSGHGQGGMTLLDYFAGQALAGIKAKKGVDINRPRIAKECYDQAEEMLEERERRMKNADG